MRLDEITEIGGKKRPADKDGQRYVPAVLETYYEVKSGKSRNVHARPVKGQAQFDSILDAECSREMRENHPIGTMFLVWAILVDREGTDFVYTSWQWPYEVVGT